MNSYDGDDFLNSNLKNNRYHKLNKKLNLIHKLKIYKVVFKNTYTTNADIFFEPNVSTVY